MKRILALAALCSISLAFWFFLADHQWLVAVVMLVLMGAGAWFYVNVLFPPGRRRVMFFGHDGEESAEVHQMPEAVERVLQAAYAEIAELGPYRLEGPAKILCPLCHTWCVAEVMIAGHDDSPAYGIGVLTGQAVMLHCELTLHVHNHECPAALALVAELNEAERDGA